MDKELRAWIDEAIGLCEAASRKNVTVVLRYALVEEGDHALVTNATSADIIRELGTVLNGPAEIATE